MRMSELSEEFFEILLEIQKDQADLIENDIDVWEAFGMVRSSILGDTTRSQAMNVSQDSIDWMNFFFFWSGLQCPKAYSIMGWCSSIPE